MLMRDWSSDVCSSDLGAGDGCPLSGGSRAAAGKLAAGCRAMGCSRLPPVGAGSPLQLIARCYCQQAGCGPLAVRQLRFQFMVHGRSEEHTSELQSLMRISYAVFCLKKKN